MKPTGAKKSSFSGWIFMTCVCLCSCSRPTIPTSSLWPSYQHMSLTRAIEILQKLGIGTDTETCPKAYLDSQEDLPKAYDTVQKDLLTLAGDCDRYEPYRSPTGICNNRLSPMWGAALHTQRRLLPNAYLNGKDIPRLTGKESNYLASARTVSIECFPPNFETKEFLDEDVTQMVMQFGQYIDHDLIFTEMLDGSGCCDNPRNAFIHPHIFNGGPCFPIEVRTGDRFFTKSCMPFKRSFAVTLNGVREQINGMSSFVDATTVYGSSVQQQNSLRAGIGGLLKVSAGNFLPLQGTFKCVTGTINQCPSAGDTRVSVFPGLTILHLVFHREHNRVAKKLARINPHWNDERLFQEARKIVIAIHQKIVYDDFLPPILGNDVMDIFDINKPYVYDPNLDASIINSFGAAAFRFGHSQINSLLKVNGTLRPISELFFRSFMTMNEDVIKEIVSDQAKDLVQKADNHFSTEVSDRLFIGVDAPNLSTDLPARNVQRGRDHGLPSYLEYFDYCRKRMGYRPLVDQYNLPLCLTTDVYKSVDDIDLFVGGLHEKHLKGAMVGPTFACILGEQFWRLKFGDRFFYETNNTKIGFKPDQIQEIKKTSMTTVLCRNSQVSRLQPDIFKPVKKSSNPNKSCSHYHDIDFSKWKEV